MTKTRGTASRGRAKKAVASPPRSTTAPVPALRTSVPDPLDEQYAALPASYEPVIRPYRPSGVLERHGARFFTFDRPERGLHLNLPGPMRREYDPDKESTYDAELARFMDHIRQDGANYPRVPYVFLHHEEGKEPVGDYTGIDGAALFESIRSCFIPGPFQQDTEMIELRELIQLLSAKNFEYAETILTLRGFRLLEGGVPELAYGASDYNLARFGPNSDSVILSLNPPRRKRQLAIQYEDAPDQMVRLQELVETFAGRYNAPDLTAREVVALKYSGLPPLEHAYDFILGGACLVITEDGYMVFGLRTARNTSNNYGYNLPTAGGAKFDLKRIREMGLPGYLKYHARAVEAVQEMGVQGDQCHIIPLAFIRELGRGCVPDMIYALFFYGSLSELIECMRNNPHDDAREMDKVLVLRTEEALKLIFHEDVTRWWQVHHKAIAALVMYHRYLEARKQDRVAPLCKLKQ